MFGLGIDITEVNDFCAHDRSGNKAAVRDLLFTSNERSECEVGDAAVSFAACFAAKEAVVKAAGAVRIRALIPQVEVTQGGACVGLVSRRGECVSTLNDKALFMLPHPSVLFLQSGAITVRLAVVLHKESSLLPLCFREQKTSS